MSPLVARRVFYIIFPLVARRVFLCFVPDWFMKRRLVVFCCGTSTNATRGNLTDTFVGSTFGSKLFTVLCQPMTLALSRVCWTKGVSPLPCWVVKTVEIGKMVNSVCDGSRLLNHCWSMMGHFSVPWRTARTPRSTSIPQEVMSVLCKSCVGDRSSMTIDTGCCAKSCGHKTS